MTCIHHCRQPGNSIIFGLGSLSCGLCAFSISPCCSVRPGDGGRGLGGRGRTLVCAWRLRKRTCVIYSESDDNDLVAQNALSLGAPGKNIMIHFYSSRFYTNSFVGGEKCLIWHDCRGNLLVFFFSLLPLIASCPSVRGHKMCGLQDGNEMTGLF